MMTPEEQARALEAEAREIRAKAERDRREAEAREAARAAAEAKIVASKAEAVVVLDAVLREVRTLLPGSAQWADRVAAAARKFERESAPWREPAGMSRESQHRAERLLAEHPVGPLMPWLAQLRGDDSPEAPYTPA